MQKKHVNIQHNTTCQPGVLTAGPCDRSPGTAPSAAPGSSGPAPLESAPALSPPLGEAAFFLEAIRVTKNKQYIKCIEVTHYRPEH